MFSKVFDYFLLTCLKAEQVYPERGGGLPLVLQQPHAAADHERDGGGPRQVHLQVTCTTVHLYIHMYTCTLYNCTPAGPRTASGRPAERSASTVSRQRPPETKITFNNQIFFRNFMIFLAAKAAQ